MKTNIECGAHEIYCERYKMTTRREFCGKSVACTGCDMCPYGLPRPQGFTKHIQLGNKGQLSQLETAEWHARKGLSRV